MYLLLCLPTPYILYIVKGGGLTGPDVRSLSVGTSIIIQTYNTML